MRVMTQNPTLEFSIDGKVAFTSSRKWLHPLFELEQFLKAMRLDMNRTEIRDKIIGRGSAFLIIRMGIRKVHAGVLSRIGKDVLDRAGASVTWDSLVDTIQCRTEGLLRDVTDPEDAYRVLADIARADANSAGDKRPKLEGSAVSPSAAGR